MDALSEILRAARLSGGVFLWGEFTEPWGLASAVTPSDCSDHLGPADHLVLYHYVLEGKLTVTLPGETPEVFGPGEAVVFPRNDRHTLSGEKPAKAVSALDVARIPKPGGLMVIEHGGGGALTRIVCGFLGGPALAGDPLFASLPKTIRYDCASARSGELVRTSLALATEEMTTGRPGADAMLARVSELLFVEAVRAHVEAEAEAEDIGEWLAALGDRSLSKAIALIHRNPEHAWTVEELGRAVGASRSTLAAKFKSYLGHAPGECMTQLRMRLAARELVVGNAPMAKIAESVGYGSEAAFSRAFKRYHGVSPSEWRRTQGG